MYKSIIDGDRFEVCFLCGGRACHTHHIFGGPCRKRCDSLRLTVRLCAECHTKVHDTVCPEMQYLYEVGQRTYEDRIGSREQFIQDFIRSYL